MKQLDTPPGRIFTPAVEKSPLTEFQTPPEVAEYMVGLLPPWINKVLEPTKGLGNIVNVLDDQHYFVHSPTDFFTLDSNKMHFDAVVMNPPFSTKYAFNVPEGFEHTGMRLGYYMLTECMKMSNHVIALMPWFTISDSDLRLRALKEFGLKSVTALPRKTFKYARIQTCVIELWKGWHGTTPVSCVRLPKTQQPMSQQLAHSNQIQTLTEEAEKLRTMRKRKQRILHVLRKLK